MNQPVPRTNRRPGDTPPPSATLTPASAPQHATPEHPRAPKRRPLWLALFSILGPGVISAAAGNDAGGIATYSQVGAKYGLSLMWTMVVVTIGLVVVQEMCARMAAVTGKGLADLIRENFGVKVAFVAMAALVAANFALTVSEFAGIAAVGEMFLGPHSRVFVVPLAMVVVWLLVSRGSYRRVESIFIVASLIFVTYIITGFRIGVPWGQVLASSFTPALGRLHWDNDLIVMIVTVIGTTISPYMQFYQQSAVRDKGVQMKDYALVKWDTIIGCVASDLVAAFIIITCAGTLYVHGHHDIGSAQEAAQALEPLAGHYAQFLFAFGLLNASLMAAVIVPLSTAYAVTEAMGWEGGLGRRVRESPLFFGTYGFLILFGGLLVILVSPQSNLIQMILNAQIINCALLPVELVLMLILINRRRVMGKYRNGLGYNIVAWATTLIAGSLSLFLIARQVWSMIHPG
jgi:NRAMP (natural resistance-associated macrophage protein)-like metal ion transporter